MWCSGVSFFITVHRMEGTRNPVFSPEYEINQFPEVSFMAILYVSQ
jgi:hypothetical protein